MNVGVAEFDRRDELTRENAVTDRSLLPVSINTSVNMGKQRTCVLILCLSLLF